MARVGKEGIESNNPTITSARCYKTIPKNMIFDKEALYDNALKLKQYSNNLAEENYKLKAKLLKTEEDMSRKNKLINGLMAQMGSLSHAPKIVKMQKEVLFYI